MPEFLSCFKVYRILKGLSHQIILFPYDKVDSCVLSVVADADLLKYGYTCKTLYIAEERLCKLCTPLI